MSRSAHAPLGPGCGVCSSDLEPREDCRLDPCNAAAREAFLLLSTNATGLVNETWDSALLADWYGARDALPQAQAFSAIPSVSQRYNKPSS